MSASEVVFWWCMIIAQISFACCCFRLVYKEYTKRKLQTETVSNAYQTWLNRWSMLALILLTVCLAVKPLEKWYPLCKWVFVISAYFYLQAKVIITFYQIARLQYCFAQSQVHSKYGYSKGWFIFLYVNGLIILIALTYLCLKSVFIGKWHRDKHMVCYIDSSAERDIIRRILVIYFILWDWTVFGCYIMKICQFYKKNDNAHKSVLSRVKFIVYQITFLALILELLSLFSVMVAPVMVKFDVHVILRLVIVILVISESFGTAYIVYLMLAHNNTEYVIFIKRLDRFGIFCCCRTFVDIALSMDIEVELGKEVEQNRKGTDLDTRTVIEMPQQITLPQHMSVESVDSNDL